LELLGEIMERFKFGKINIILFILAIIMLIVGYIILKTGDRSISTVLLVLGYLVFIPAAFLIKTK